MGLLKKYGSLIIIRREYVLPHRNDPEALKEPPEMYDFIELSDWQSFVISRLSENWQV